MWCVIRPPFHSNPSPHLPSLFPTCFCVPEPPGPLSTRRKRAAAPQPRISASLCRLSALLLAHLPCPSPFSCHRSLLSSHDWSRLSPFHSLCHAPLQKLENACLPKHTGFSPMPHNNSLSNGKNNGNKESPPKARAPRPHAHSQTPDRSSPPMPIHPLCLSPKAYRLPTFAPQQQPIQRQDRTASTSPPTQLPSSSFLSPFFTHCSLSTSYSSVSFLFLSCF